MAKEFSSASPAKRAGPVLPALALGTATLAAYWPALAAGFVWNDRDYVTAPALQSAAGLRRIWFVPGATEQYYPLLHSFFWVQHRVWGDRALGYHLTGVLLHVTAALLLAAVLLRLAAPAAAWCGACLFALHPVAVESVAWVSEQKNTLSTVFYLLAALVFLRWHGSRTRAAYLTATGLFLAALLAKTVTATLPAALLVVLWWKQGALDRRRDVRPLLPWFVLAAGAGLFSAWMERTFIGASGPAFALSFPQRLLIAGRVPWFYLGKLLWPVRLVFIYPRWVPRPAALAAWLYPLLTLTVLAVLWRVRAHRRAWLAAALYFVGTLFPVLGFFNVYAFLFSFVADHFQYLASIGIFAACGGAWASAWSRRALPAGLALAVAGMLLGALTWRQCRLYHDPETFYAAIVARNPSAWMARNNLGLLLSDEGRYGAAIDAFQASLALRPQGADAHYNLANALLRAGRTADAIASYRQAVALAPSWAEAQSDLATALVQTGRTAEAIDRYRTALDLRPASAEIWYDLGVACGRAGNLPAATDAFRRAIQLGASGAPVHDSLGVALLRSGQIAAAVVELRKAVQLDARSVSAHHNLALALKANGQIVEAVKEQLEAYRLLGRSPPP